VEYLEHNSQVAVKISFFDTPIFHLYNASAMLEKDELHEDDVVHDEHDSAHSEDIELADEEALSSQKLKDLRDTLKACESEKMASLENLQRAKADFLNSRRRLDEQSAIDKERAAERVIIDFLPLVDSFELALGNGEVGEEASWVKGITAMQSQFLSILKNYGVKEIEATGKQFNPYEHEAVASRKGEAGEEHGTVLQVLQKGYKRGDTVIRPARVITAE